MPTCCSCLVAAAFMFVAGPASTQALQPIGQMAAEAHPSFEVSVIKPHNPDVQQSGMGFRPGAAAIRDQTLARLLMFTYAINPRQIVDSPDWVQKLSYDIDARFDKPGNANLQQQQEMLRKLFADRFELRFHMEKRELPAYAIRLAKGGPKLKPALPEEQLDQDGSGNSRDRTMVFTNAAIPNLILGMQFFLDRPLVDQTGLQGRYDFTIHFAEDASATTDPNAPPGLFTAVQDQLGLKFEPTKAVVDVLVIDHVKQPSPN